MTEAIFGLIGVLIGSSISWLQTFWTNKRTDDKNAKYLAIRIVCILDKFVEDCIDVVKDDGLSEGQPNAEGCLEPQVEAPRAPIYPDDVDWKSIDHDLMYQLLSLPSEVEDGNRFIQSASMVAGPPNFEEWFDERKFYYCKFGLAAYKLSEDLCTGYKINRKRYNNDWNPAAILKQELEEVITRREHRRQQNRLLFN